MDLREENFSKSKDILITVTFYLKKWLKVGF